MPTFHVRYWMRLGSYAGE
uniref:Uncharacterized protein n=1 Tax=Rhizophora mucronata TaxID=61149 RepID=A0A2P2R0P1_RHIMU